jgi:hypothetical protein
MVKAEESWQRRASSAKDEVVGKYFQKKSSFEKSINMTRMMIVPLSMRP